MSNPPTVAETVEAAFKKGAEDAVAPIAPKDYTGLYQDTFARVLSTLRLHADGLVPDAELIALADARAAAIVREQFFA